MKARDFTYWLRGYFELTGSDNLTEEQVKEIKRHLDMVFLNTKELVFNESTGWWEDPDPNMDGVVFFHPNNQSC